MSLLISSRKDSDGTVRIRTVGEIDVDNAYQIREATDWALTGGSLQKIVIDLASTPLIDSVGIGVLVSCYHAAAASQVPLVVADPSPLVYRQLWISGLAGLFGLPTIPRRPRGAWRPEGATSQVSGFGTPTDPAAGDANRA